jgi:hypothetical protein
MLMGPFIAADGVLVVRQQNLQKLIRENSRELLILYSVETGAGERTYFECMNQNFAANSYKSFTIFDSHHGPFTFADGVLVGVGCGLGWYDSKICKNSSEKKIREVLFFTL